MSLKVGDCIYPENVIFSNVNNILKYKPISIIPKSPKGTWWNFNTDQYGELYFVLCANCNWIKRYENKETR